MGLLSLGTSSRTATSQASPSSTPVSASSPFETFTAWLETRLSELNVPGAAVGVYHRDEVHTSGFGVTRASTDDPFTTSTRFGIASLTKMFTATALASLAQDGALTLDDPVSQYLSEFSLAAPDATAAVTIGHLLSHAGGWADVLEPVPGQNSLTWYASQMANLPQIVPVGTHFSYSNSGFLLAGAVVEQVAGAPYEDVISQSILHPLGMQHTDFPAQSDSSTNRATGHQIVDGEMAAITVPDTPRAVNPAAGLVSNVENMLAFARAHTSIDGDDPSLIDPGALAAMRSPRIDGGSVGPIVVDHIGTGWMLLDIDGETVLMSQGGDSGQISAMIAVPSRQFGMVIFANSDTAMTLVNDAVLRGLSTFTGLTIADPEQHPLSDEEAEHAAGRFGLAEWMTFTVTPDGGSILLTTSVEGQEIPDLSGRFTMTSPSRGFMSYLGGRLWLDLVPDSTGSIQWLRFAARLVPRIE